MSDSAAAVTAEPVGQVASYLPTDSGGGERYANGGEGGLGGRIYIPLEVGKSSNPFLLSAVCSGNVRVPKRVHRWASPILVSMKCLSPRALVRIKSLIFCRQRSSVN